MIAFLGFLIIYSKSSIFRQMRPQWAGNKNERTSQANDLGHLACYSHMPFPLSHLPADQSNRPTSSLFSHNDEEREAEASQQDCGYLLYKNFKNEYATQIHATVRGWRDGQVFTHHRRLDQYNGERERQQRQLQDERRGGGRNKIKKL